MRESTGELLSNERSRGVFSRQLILGDNLDLDKITASYRDGVLRLEIPVAERAKPRKIQIATAFVGQLDTNAEIIGYSGTAAAASARAFLRTVM